MIWYYAHERNRVGPVDDAEFEALVDTGVITPETLVWNETLTEWVRYADVLGPYAELAGTASQQATATQQPTVTAQQQTRQTATCHECGRLFPQNNMIRYSNINQFYSE